MATTAIAGLTLRATKVRRISVAIGIRMNDHGCLHESVDQKRTILLHTKGLYDG